MYVKIKSPDDLKNIEINLLKYKFEMYPIPFDILRKYRLLTIVYTPKFQIYKLNFVNRIIFYVDKPEIQLSGFDYEIVEFLPLQSLLQFAPKK